MAQNKAAVKPGEPQSYGSKCENGERRVDVVEPAAFASLYAKPLRFLVS